MPNSVMPETRVYEVEGVRIEYLTYPTLRSRLIEQALRAAYEKPSPTADDPDAGSVPREVFAFYRAMPSIVSVVLPETPPLWGVFLKGMIEANDWLEDPVRDFRHMRAYAPEMVVYHAFNGHEETREKVMAAPTELQSSLTPVDEFDEALTPEQKDAKKKTLIIGGASSTPKSSPARGARSAAPTRTKR